MCAGLATPTDNDSQTTNVDDFIVQPLIDSIYSEEINETLVNDEITIDHTGDELITDLFS